jgi:hypothetical protein
MKKLKRKKKRETCWEVEEMEYRTTKRNMKGTKKRENWKMKKNTKWKKEKKKKKKMEN